MSAMQKAFENAGTTAADVQFDIAIAKYLNSGGTFERALQRVHGAAARMPGMGLASAASDGHTRYAQTRQPLEDGGARFLVPQGQSQSAPSSSSDRGGEGHDLAAGNGQKPHALPVRDPKPQRAAIDFGEAALAIKTQLALTVLDTLKIDGRAIGDWTVADARRLGPQKTREGHILMAATQKVANAQGFQLIRDVLKAEELQLIMQKAAEVSDEIPA